MCQVSVFKHPSAPEPAETALRFRGPEGQPLRSCPGVPALGPETEAKGTWVVLAPGLLGLRWAPGEGGFGTA